MLNQLIIHPVVLPLVNKSCPKCEQAQTMIILLYRFICVSQMPGPFVIWIFLLLCQTRYTRNCIVMIFFQHLPSFSTIANQDSCKSEGVCQLFGFFGAAHGLGVGQKSSPPKNLSHIYYNETLHSYTLPKEDPKILWIAWHIP